jgi:hypothetical protein
MRGVQRFRGVSGGFTTRVCAAHALQVSQNRLCPSCLHVTLGLWHLHLRARFLQAEGGSSKVRHASVGLLHFGAASRAGRGSARRGAGQGHTRVSGWCVCTGSGGARAAALLHRLSGRLRRVVAGLARLVRGVLASGGGQRDGVRVVADCERFRYSLWL